MFIDRVVVNVKAGDGGSGITSFRREKFVPMGGPDGGEGGRGGDVVIVGDSNLATLLDYTYRDSWTAPAGDHGSGNNKSGKSGGDEKIQGIVLDVIAEFYTARFFSSFVFFICAACADVEGLHRVDIMHQDGALFNEKPTAEARRHREKIG